MNFKNYLKEKLEEENLYSSLLEVFNTESEYELKSMFNNEVFDGYFLFDGEKFDISIVKRNLKDFFGQDLNIDLESSYEFLFSDKNQEMAISGKFKEKAIKIFGIVANILKDWVTKYKPESFYFTANESSRRKLYDAFARMIANKLPYELDNKTSQELEKDGDSADKFYIFVKKGN